MAKVYEGKMDASGIKAAIVVSRFNEFVTSKLEAGAIDALVRQGAREEDISIFRVPGGFEIPLMADKLAKSGTYDTVICLGAVIKGSTPHNVYICSEVTKGIAQAAIQSGVPVAFGVLTTDTQEQAIERAGSKVGNKGFEAAMAAIEMVNLYKVADV
ncbi:MAG: 6,7-dimethyl-8-ribityllumazine synthase [Candidatus Sumerlaeia bacterium]